MIPAVILAGGRATRMSGSDIGLDKGLIELGGETVLARIVARLAPQAAPLALNANGDPARFAAFRLPVLPDPVPGFPGPLAGVLAALLWADGLGAPSVATVAADTPFFPTDLVARLAAAGPFALAESDSGLEPAFGLWPVARAADLRAALEAGERRVGKWALGAGARPVRFADDAAFFNLNTPEDVAAARKRLG